MLDVILDKSFIDNFGNYNSREGRELEKILLNENNRFIISTSLLDFIEGNPSYEKINKWKHIFTFLSDTGKVYSIENCDTLNVDVIYDKIEVTDNIVIVLKNSNNASYSNDYTIYLDDTSFKNKFILKILQTNQVTFRNTDFNSNAQINDFFRQLIFCSKTNKSIVIISRYNKFNCELIDIVKSKFQKKEFWTTLKEDNCETNNVMAMKLRLGTFLKIYTGNNRQIHERKIIIGNLILEFDDDFDKIKSSITTWTGSCIVNKNIASTLYQKREILSPLN